MSQQLLTTGISGFIARHVALALRRSIRSTLAACTLLGGMAAAQGAVAQEYHAPERAARDPAAAEQEAQKRSLKDFAFLIGEWEGELDYLDYGDDSTRVRLPTRLSCLPDSTGQALVLEFTYREPDGRTMTGAEELRLLDEPGWVSLGDPWQIDRVFAPVFTGERILALNDAMIERTGASPFAGWIDRIQDREPPDGRLVRVDVTGYVEQGRDALRAHRTQIDPDGFWFQVPTDVVEAVYPWEDFELLTSSRPDDAPSGDLFDGLS